MIKKLEDKKLGPSACGGLMPPAEPRAAVERFAFRVSEIGATSAFDADAVGFMARGFISTTLPHSKLLHPDGRLQTEFTRHNGNVSLTIRSDAGGLPYGSIPRLLLTWLATEAVRKKSRNLELGATLSAFMAQLDLVPTGGRWGSITRLREQADRLFSSMITFSRSAPGVRERQMFPIASKSMLCWNKRSPDQAGLWESQVVLSQEFFDEITDRPVPVDMRVLRALRQSPMALDVYAWLTFRTFYLTKNATVSWKLLADQFGSHYGRIHDFREAFNDALEKVVLAYPGVRVEPTKAGLVLKPGLPSVHRLPSYTSTST